MRKRENWRVVRDPKLAVAAVIALVLVALILVPEVKAGDQPHTLGNAPAQGQVYNDDLVVRDGEVIRGDVVTYNSDVTVEEGGRIGGNVTVYSGDVTVEEGGVIDGDVTAWSGDVEIDGVVNGSISAASGNVDLGATAKVGGDISVMSGHIEQQMGASVSGSLLRAPKLALPAPPAPPVPDLPWFQGSAGQRSMRESSWLGGVGSFLVRLLFALLGLGAAVGGAAALAALRPQWVDATTDHLRKQSALSFAIGLLVNVLVSVVVAFLFIIVCFRPPGVLLGVALFALNVAGMAAVGEVIGSRLDGKGARGWSLPARVALGVLIPSALVALLYFLGGWFSFYAYLAALVISSFGVGAVITRYLNLSSPPRPAPPGTPAEAAPTAGGVPSATVVSATAAAAAVPAVAAAAHDDLTQLPGIGPEQTRQLNAAGVTSFGALAGMSAAEVAKILGWSEDRVERSQMIELAGVLGR